MMSLDLNLRTTVHRSNLANHPVVGITWYEMLAYCRWLTDQLRESTLAPAWLREILHNEG